MSTPVGRVFSGLTRAAFSRETFTPNSTSTVRLNSLRSLALSFQRSAKSPDDDKEVNYEPLKFSSSKASHRTWKVSSSMGGQHQRPWWKVLPLSLFGVSLLLWCALRAETGVDAQLEQQLYHHLPSLISDEEEEQNKSS